MTKKDFAIFKKHVKKWCIELGVKDWGVTADMDELVGNRAAECEYESQNRYSCITIDNGIEDPSSKNLEVVAKHEVLELVMADIRDALCMYYAENFVDKMIHRVIRKLENAL